MFASLDLLITFPAFDAMALELFLPLFFLWRKLGGWKLKLSDETQVDVHLLHPVTVHLLRRVDDDLFYEFVDHRRGQLGEIRVLLRQGEKLFGAGRIFLKGGDPGLGFGNGNVKLFLFCLIVRKQAVKALGADPAYCKRFIELLNDPVQLIPAFPVLVQLSAGILCGVLLTNLRGCPYLLKKLFRIGDGVGADRSNGLENQGAEGLRRDEMSLASFISLLAGQRIGGAVEEIRREIPLILIAPCAVVVHLLPTVGAVHKAGQGIRHAEGVNTLGRLPKLLSKLPGLPIHDRFMGVLKDQPVLLRIGNTGLVLVGFLV